MQRRRQVGQHEGVRVLRADEVAALFGQIGLVALFVNGEEQLLLFAVKVHLFLVPVQFQFGLVHQPQILGILQQFHQALGFRLAGFDAEQQQADFMFQRVGVRHVGAVGRDSVF